MDDAPKTRPGGPGEGGVPPTAGGAAPVPRDARARRIGPYEVLAEIGRGGMGVVYKAFHPGLKRTVALKVLMAGEDASEEAIARFHREAEAVARLGHHPNIVPVYDVGQGPAEGSVTATQVHYIAMHYVEGVSLDRLVDEGELAPAHAARIAKGIAEALAHAHAHGILHRDVKPANILLARAGDERDGATHHDVRGVSPAEGRATATSAQAEPMLTDFGLAKDVACDTRVTASGTALGTPNYMPPEQARGDLVAVDARSDVYSLGATLYEMLTFRPPFEGSTILEVIQKVLFRDPPAPRRLAPSLPRDLETVCLKCLEKDPARRYGDARALSADLGRYLDGRPILARPVSTWERVVRRARRNALATAAFVLLAGVVAAAAVSAWFGVRSYRRGSEALREEQRQAEARAGEAQERADAAEERRRETARRMDKGRKVTRALLMAEKKLSSVTATVREGLMNAATILPERRARYALYEKGIEEILASAPDDPASQATILALVGWLKYQGAFEEEGLDLMARARETDPEVSWGYLFEAMLWLTQYLVYQPMASPAMVGGRLVFTGRPPETEKMRRARERFEALLEGASTGIWGEGTEDLGEILVGVRRMQEGDLETAERSLDRALVVPELSWLEDTIRYARAKVRCLRLDLDGAVEDLDLVVRRHPGHYAGHLLLCANLAWRARRTRKAGEDPRDDAEAALREGDRVVALIPDWPSSFQVRGYARLTAALVEEDREGDPREALRVAIEDFVKSEGDGNRMGDLFLQRGHARYTLGCWEARFGGDPSDLFRAAQDDLDRAHRTEPGDATVLRVRAELLMNFAGWEQRQRRDPGALVRQGLADLDGIASLDAAEPVDTLRRGQFAKILGHWEAQNGRDPLPRYAESVARFDEAAQGGYDEATFSQDRGDALYLVGTTLVRQGQDPSDAFARARTDFAEHERQKPRDPFGAEMAGGLNSWWGDWLDGKGLSPLEKYGDAMAAYARAAERAPARGDLLLFQAIVHMKVAQWRRARGQEALADFEKAAAAAATAVQRDPAVANGFAYLGAACRQVADLKAAAGEGAAAWYEKSVKAFDETVRRTPGDFRMWMHRGTALYALARYGEARASYERGFEVARRTPGAAQAPRHRDTFALAHLNLAGCLAQEPNAGEGLGDLAVSHLREAVGLGLRDAKRLEHPAFESLRARSDFMDLQRQMQGK